jgi:uncharacterized membrane-anchored protein
MSYSARDTAAAVRVGAVKVPAITAVFWVVKVLTTGMGEAASDWLGSVSLALAGAVGVLGIAVALVLQVRADRYRPVRYWFAVAMVAVFGTMAADALHVVLDIPYAVSTAVYALALPVVFVLWRRGEGTLSVHTITPGRRERWYWLTVLLTFALGTAAGDLTAFVLHLGYLGSAVLFAVAIAVPAVGWRLGVNPVAAFWTAYVLTRPLGASLADWLGKAPRLSGLGWGDGTVTAGATVAIVAAVGWLAGSGRAVQTAEPAAVAGGVPAAGNGGAHR